jgi:hypothetical protein
MEFLEKDLEQIIWESDNELLQQKGLNINGIKKRQLRIGNYGISDIVTFEKKYTFDHYNETYLPYLDISIFELKKDKVGIGAFLQSLKYCKGIKTYLKTKKPNIPFKLNVILASKEVDKNGDFIYLTDLINSDEYGYINNIDFYSFKYDINGIEFKNECNYDLIHSGF